MNESIIKNFNSIISNDDELYLLGDCILGDTEQNIEYLKRLNGKIHIILGNHDTIVRQSAYKSLNNIIDVKYADMIKIKTENGTFNFYLSHFPTHTANLDDEKPLKQRIINICGHNHTTYPFSDWDKYHSPIFHCEVDTNNGYPWLIDDIIYKMKEKLGEV